MSSFVSFLSTNVVLIPYTGFLQDGFEAWRAKHVLLFVVQIKPRSEKIIMQMDI